MLRNVSLDSLKDLDFGRVNTAFEHELKRAVADCMDRPADSAKRTITLELALTPVCDPEGTAEGAHGEFSIKSKVPMRKSKTYSFGLNRKGQLFYSDESPENVNQTTINEMDGSGRVKRQHAE